MKKFTAISTILAVVCMCGLAQGAITWNQVDFTSVVHGAISYDASGGNIVQSGTTFFDALTTDDYLSTQEVGGDNIDNPISGNFGMYAVLNFSDASGVFPWVSANGDVLLAIEIRAWDVDLDVDIGGDGSYDESFTLNAVGLPWNYLTATFNEIGGWGCTDIAGVPGDGFDAWLDMSLLAYDGQSGTGTLALSVVLNNMYSSNWANSYNATIVAGDQLQGYTPGVTYGSGIRVAAIPEPGTIIIWSVLGAGSWLGMRVYRRRQSPIERRSWSPENRQAINEIIARGMQR